MVATEWEVLQESRAALRISRTSARNLESIKTRGLAWTWASGSLSQGFSLWRVTLLEAPLQAKAYNPTKERKWIIPHHFHPKDNLAWHMTESITVARKMILTHCVTVSWRRGLSRKRREEFHYKQSRYTPYLKIIYNNKNPLQFLYRSSKSSHKGKIDKALSQSQLGEKDSFTVLVLWC